MRLITGLVCFSAFAWTTRASAEDVRVHVAAGGAHAIGGAQSSEFGVGGTGAATVELPVASRIGLQGSAGALVLGKGEAPKDPTLQPTSTGAAFLGTAGVRVRAFGATRVAGPWIDSNVGVARTGDLTRPAFDAHLGWDVRVSRSSRVDVGPFVGYTQIFQPDTELRGGDARIFTAGISVSLGAKERARPAEPKGVEQPAPPAEPPMMDPPQALAEAAPIPTCPDGEPVKDGEDGCVGEVRIFENRILLDDVIHFEFDSPWIRTSSHRLVRKVARFINEHAELLDITIEGHADEVGSEAYNQRLSESRAASMRDLLRVYGVDGSRLRVVAHGKSRPKIVTLRPEPENRRVELFFTRTREERTTAYTITDGRTSR